MVPPAQAGGAFAYGRKKPTKKVKKGVDKDRQGVYNTSSRHERGTSKEGR